MIETARIRSESPWHPRAEAADPADDEVDAHAGLARRVELLDERAVHQAVHLGDDPGAAAGPRVLGLAADADDQPVAQPGRRHQQVLEGRGAACSR